MRSAGFGALTGVLSCLAGACIPVEPEWVVTDPRFRGVKVEVVEPGGYASLLHVPEGKRRATLLPLDTVEFTWHVTAAEDELPPPIWLVCDNNCIDSGVNNAIAQLDFVGLKDCPSPLPLSPPETCRLGEGWQIRAGLAGAFSYGGDIPYLLPLIVIGSRQPELAPASCLERLSTQPISPSESCLFSRTHVYFGPAWAVLPFGDLPALPQEFREQEVDTNPEITAFAVTRERSGTRIELVADPGADVPVRRGERISVEPIFAAGSAQSYYVMTNGEGGEPGSGEPSLRNESLQWRGWFSAPIDGYEPHADAWHTELQWTVPHDVVPTTLYVDVRDGRGGVDFAELRFVADGSAP
ncbi:hypothetical protein OV203_49825 [Nannocystis sp. ILAH1]|uniref:hypothetical protein n=1 Tax=Nannocystis sp. ILAH1 TaxID=2996789 RepID=UPI002270AC61|nr:hypothetical protein [Nannocystis sp. ILAH1]MCY0995325.1 hypothetical protein [Nannocystis sp. ILAH1]